MKNFKTRTYLIAAILGLLLLPSALATITANSPSACSGSWSTCTNAFANDANRATAVATNTANFTGTWQNYSFSLGSDTIDSVIVVADYFASNVRGYISVRVSGDGGATWGPAHVVGGNTAEQRYNIDVTSDLSWTSSMLDNSNLRVNATCFKNPTSSTNPTCRLDWMPVNVTHSPPDISPVASPSSNATSGTVPLKIRFTGGYTAGNGPHTFSWTFQDGNTSSAQNVTNVFTTAGTYNVSFTVTDNDGDASTAYILVTALPVNSCSDSDGGINTLTQGTVTGNASGSPYSFTDFCAGTFSVTEYRCSGTSPQAINQSCLAGCDSGRCLRANLTTTVLSPADHSQYGLGEQYNTTLQVVCGGEAGAICPNIRTNVSFSNPLAQFLPNNDKVHDLGNLSVGSSIETTWLVQTNQSGLNTTNAYNAGFSPSGAGLSSASQKTITIELI